MLNQNSEKPPETHQRAGHRTNDADRRHTITAQALSGALPAPADNPNPTLWGTQPCLGSSFLGIYLGRLFVEVWQQDVHFVAAQSEILVTAALAAMISHTDHAVSMPACAWTDDPVTGTVPGQAYLGRVVAEVWSNKVHTYVAGQQSLLLRQRAIADLTMRVNQLPVIGLAPQ